MYHYSKLSKARLSTCHADLQIIFNEVIKYVDVSIICGHRGKEEQNAAFDAGYSQVQFPDGKHNTIPSMAVDVTPYPEMYSDANELRRLAGYVIATAQQLYNQGKISHLITNGSDWDNDFDEEDHRFIDLPHYELYTL